MNELLTTRQVQDLLKVDRITIYRMLNDGRLKGVKIGQQWRFPSSEIERFLSGIPSTPTPSKLETPIQGFPAHCVQTIQNLFTEISQLGALVVDLDGNLLTEPSNACHFCQLVQSTPRGMAGCQESWQEIASSATEQDFICHAGLRYLRAPIEDDGKLIGWFLAGQVCWHHSDNAQDRVSQLAAVYGIAQKDLLDAAGNICRLDESDRGRVEDWPQQTRIAIQAILMERSGLMQRLQSIANMTKMEE